MEVTPPGAPRRGLAGVWLVAAAIVVAGALIAAAIWVVKTDDRAIPAPAAEPSMAVSVPSGAPYTPESNAAPCEAWKARAPKRAAVPAPPAGWNYQTPGIQATLERWAAAVSPILDDLEATGLQNPAPGDDLLRQYISAQREALTAATGGTYTATAATRVSVAKNSLDVMCQV